MRPGPAPKLAVDLEYTASDFIGERFVLEHRSFLLKIIFCHGIHGRTRKNTEEHGKKIKNKSLYD
jgi:hypothetical protein